MDGGDDGEDEEDGGDGIDDNEDNDGWRTVMTGWNGWMESVNSTPYSSSGQEAFRLHADREPIVQQTDRQTDKRRRSRSSHDAI